jgi:hypothetical protein
MHCFSFIFKSGTIVEAELDAACVTNKGYLLVIGNIFATVLALWAMSGTVTGTGMIG